MAMQTLVPCQCLQGLIKVAKRESCREASSPPGNLRSGAASWETLPAPVSDQAVRRLLPHLLCKHDSIPGHLVLFLHLGSFDLKSLDELGCTRRDLIRKCEKTLRSSQSEVPSLEGLHIVADLHEVTLRQLNSHWWQKLLPHLLAQLEDKFPGLLQEILFVRAGKTAAAAAERILQPLDRIAGVVRGGDEIAAEMLIKSRGLSGAVEGLFRDPHQDAADAACQERQRRQRWQLRVLVALLMLVLLGAVVYLQHSISELGAAAWKGGKGGKGSSFATKAMSVGVRAWAGARGPAGAAATAAVLAVLGAMRLKQRPDAAASLQAVLADDTAKLLVLLLGSPIAWAAVLLGQVPAVVAATMPALSVVMLGLLLLRAPPQPSAKAVRFTVASPSAASPRMRKDAWWPEMFLGEHGEPRFEEKNAAEPSLLPSPPFEGDALQLLSRLQEICQACRQVSWVGRSPAASTNGTNGLLSRLNIQCVAKEEGRSVWFAQEPDNPVLLVASEVLLATPEPLEAVLWAIYSAEERMKWDGASFSSFKVLCERQVQPSSRALGDYLYIKLKLPLGVKDRDMLQERFVLCLPDDEGYAIVIHSCSAVQEKALRREPLTAEGVIRANTRLSGYLLRPAPSGQGVLLTGISQTDLGGNVPQWVQALVKKATKKLPLDFAQRLEDHCNRRAGLDVARRKMRLAEIARGLSREFTGDGRCFPPQSSSAGAGRQSLFRRLSRSGGECNEGNEGTG
eukprot:TRINITY_DN25853_c0_g1_i1.p1 TRINITY_DN25853_c0_g1~~TRINITY_DN25853_c0_g1_i1.p1  ORF type:complete len:737 (-),score=176.11 TRINITY_DN25853_c0_g1_i1:12-2222(-)